MSGYYVGLMSGTSMDALDAVLVDFEGEAPHLIAALSTPLPPVLRASLFSLTSPGDNEIARLGEADVALGAFSAECVTALLDAAGIPAESVIAIGSHGQTVRHGPDAPHPYTLQIGDPNTIAQQSGVATVADFRRRDIAAGGQGAPLVPAFHAALFRHQGRNRVIVNVGGMANVTILPAANSLPVSGFDTGPGNVLMDGWVHERRGQAYDSGGAWAASGRIDKELLQRLVADPYFALPPPKSTGRERFNLAWLRERLPEAIPDEDVQATLCELTACTIAMAIQRHAPDCDELFVCGGGAENGHLLSRLTALLPDVVLDTTTVLGVAPRWVEAMAFAWLARQTLLGLPGNLPAVTGAAEPVILGGIYPANRK